MKINLSQIIIGAVCCLGLLLSSCGGGNSGGGGGSNGGGDDPTLASGLSIGNISVIPVVAGASNGFFTLQLFNNTTQAITLQDYNLSNGLAKTIIDTSNCGSIPAQSVCSLGVRAPDRQNGQTAAMLSGTYNLSLSYLSQDKKHIYQAQQNISYSDEMVAQKGIYSSNWNNTVVSNSLTKSLSIPLILAESFSFLDAISKATNITPTVYCPSGYQKGRSCTLIIPATTTSLRNKVSLRGIPVLGSSLSVLFDLAVISQDSGAYLVNTGTNALINTHLGENSISLKLINLGVNDATDISIVAEDSSQLKITNSCGGTLQVGQSCNFELSMNATSSVNNTTYTISYNNGNEVQHAIYNLSYIAPNTTLPTLLINTTNNASYTLIAESAIIPFSITNIGGAILNNLSYTNLTSQNNRLSIVTGDNACLAGASLSIGESCVLYVKYTPLQTETSSMKLAVNGNYIANGNSLNYTSGYSGANYSSVGSAAQITISPKQLDFAINANNLAFQSKSLVLTNIGEVAAQIKSITLPNIAGLTLNNPNACGNTLASGAHCTLNLKFGPINHIESVASGSLRVNYLPTSSSTDSVSASVGINTKSSIVALIQVESNNTYPFGFYADGSGFISGSGSPSSPFLFSSYLNAMTVHILYSNNGSESALNFNVNTNISPGLPIAISVANSSTCATGLNTMTLAVGTSCILDLNLLSPSAASLAYNPQPVEFRIPGYSFQGITNPLTYSESRVVAANGQSSIYTQAQQAASYTMSTSRQSTSINSDGSQTAMITFNVDSFGSGVNTITFAPIITDLQGFYFSDANGNSNGISSCTTTNPAVATCTIYITAPVYAPYATYSVLYYAHVNGISSDDANTGIFTFTTHAGS